MGTAEEHYELGAVLLRKKMFTPAIDNLQKALELWESEDDQERAQAHNALGFALFQQKKHQQAAEQYACAIELDPTYLTAWRTWGTCTRPRTSCARPSARTRRSSRPRPRTASRGSASPTSSRGARPCASRSPPCSNRAARPSRCFTDRVTRATGNQCANGGLCLSGDRPALHACPRAWRRRPVPAVLHAPTPPPRPPLTRAARRSRRC